MREATSRPVRAGWWLLWAWRAILAATAGWGLWLTVGGRSLERAFDQLIYFTTLSTLAVFAFNATEAIRPFVVRGSGRARFESKSAWLRGLATTMTAFTGIVYATLLDGTYGDVAGKVTHLICPVAMALDWLAIGRNRGRLHPLSPASWAVLLLPYVLVLYPWDAREDGRPMYAFLDPAKDDWTATLISVIVAFLVLGYAVWGLGRLLSGGKAGRRDAGSRASGPRTSGRNPPSGRNPRAGGRKTATGRARAR